MTEQEVLEELVRNATLAADAVAIEWHGTNAERTRAIIKRAFEFALADAPRYATPEQRRTNSRNQEDQP
jgi:hypothetical protein